ncbi:MAG: sigma-70 family RNA polymerase sigma factor [Cetobacterium sp.]
MKNNLDILSISTIEEYDRKLNKMKLFFSSSSNLPMKCVVLNRDTSLDLEDLVAEMFAFCHKKKIQASVVVARYLLIRHLNRLNKLKRKVESGSFVCELDLNSQKDSPSIDYEGDIITKLLLESILSSEEKKLFEMKYFEGKTNIEIAKELNVVDGTIRYRLKNIVCKLKEKIKD